jgi:hypothetical protein
MLHLNGYKRVFNSDGKEVTAENLLQYIFTEPIGQVDGWTLRDLMNLIMPHKEVLGEMAWCNVDAFYAEMQKPKPEQPSWIAEKVTYIEVSQVAEIPRWDPDHLNEYMDVTGKGEDPSDRYALEFTPVNELADLPIKINETYKITRELDASPWEETIFETKKPMYLLDVIWALLWEISFAGSPDQRDAKWGEIEKAKIEADEHPERLIPAEEVFRDLHNRNFAAQQISEGPQGAD